MELTQQTQPNGVILVRLNGRMDVTGVEAVHAAFTACVAQAAKAVLVDLGEVTHLASTGLGFFLLASNNLNAKGAKLILFNPQPLVAKVFRMSGTDSILNIQKDQMAALDALG